MSSKEAIKKEIDDVPEERLDEVHRLIREFAILFNRAFERYKAYLDKTWSLVDCISFEVMKEKGLTDSLTVDKHFEQAGYNRLMKG